MTDVVPKSTEDSPWPEAFGERLRIARETSGMSQEDVHERLGFPVRSLTRWENSKSDPGFEKVARMAALYGISTDWIAGRTSIRECIQPGMVLVDELALEALSQLAAMNKSIVDLPDHLLRKPGINYATVVPQVPSVLAPEAAAAVEARVQELWRRMGGKS